MIYCRVSTKEQVEEGNSLVTQERNCREYALKNGYDIAQVFIEQGESAKTADRTELQKLFQFCANKKSNVQAVISYKIDRISRNTDDYSQIRLLLKKYGIEIKSTSEYFENTPAGRFMENIIANVAQFDNDVRTERCVGGMRDAMREGRFVWSPPVGYINKKVDGKVSIAQTEQAPLVKMAFEYIADNLYSVEEVRRKMNDLGLSNKKRNPIAKSYFYTMLHNELYAGWICKFGERHKGNFQPVISEELYQVVQRILKRKKGVRSYISQNPDFPLRRFITHPNGEKLTGSWSQGRQKKYAYYRFQVSRLQWTKKYLEEKFLSFIDQFAFNETLYTRLKKEARQQLIKRSEKNEIQIAILSEQEKTLKTKQHALVQKSLDGVISDAIVKEQMDILEDELWKIHQAIQAKSKRHTNFGMILQDLYTFFTSPAETWKNLPFHLQTELLRFEFPHGVSFDGMKFRTTNMCSIFTLKELLLTKKSMNVHPQELSYEHIKSANYPRVANKEKVLLWKEVGNDLIQLHTMLNSKKVEETTSSPLEQKVST